MRTIRLNSQLSDDEASSLAGEFLDDSHYDILVEGDSDVYRPDGEILLKYRHKELSLKQCSEVYPKMLKVEYPSGGGNRGVAGGAVEFSKIPEWQREQGVVFERGDTRYRVKKRDGTLTNTNYAMPTPSAIIGYFGRYPRIPYCRQTAFNISHGEEWNEMLPFFRQIDRCFEREMPERHAAQLEVVKKTSKDFVIHGTAFTTITVNKNWQTAVHKDAGDLPEGFGVMCALRSGRYTGGYLVFPQYRVAVDMRTGGLLLADVHQWHGNTKIVGKKGSYNRISLVFYYRKNMIECGTAAEELERARSRMSIDTGEAVGAEQLS